MGSEERFDYRGAAQYLGLAEATLRKLVSRGFLSHYKLGRLVRFSRNDLDEFLSTRHVEAANKKS